GSRASCVLLSRRLPGPTHFPYTTLFRSGGPHVRAMDMPLLNPAMSFFSYAPNFTGGVRVASGDVNGDGQEDIITGAGPGGGPHIDRKSTRLNSSHVKISYAVFCLKKKND